MSTVIPAIAAADDFVAERFREYPKPTGYGYLAGEFPSGITSRLDVPIIAKVTAIYRFANGKIISAGETYSSSDGTWVIDGLATDKAFDVICSLAGFNDLIYAGVYPTPHPALTLSSSLGLSSDTFNLVGEVTANPAFAPFSAKVVAGTAPPGISFLPGTSITASGAIRVAGDYSWQLQVTDKYGRSAEVSCSVTGAAAADPLWTKVVALLEFDTALLSDKTGRVWTSSGTVSRDTSQKYAGTASALFGANGRISSDFSDKGILLFGDFTIELMTRKTSSVAGTFLDLRPAVGTEASLLLTNPGANPDSIALYVGDATAGWDLVLTPTAVIAPNNWRPVAVVRSGDQVILFQSGLEIARGMFSGVLGLNLAALQLGNNQNSSSGLNGYMDCVRFTTAARSTGGTIAVPTEPYPYPAP